MILSDFDALNDFRNIEKAMKACIKEGDILKEL